MIKEKRQKFANAHHLSVQMKRRYAGLRPLMARTSKFVNAQKKISKSAPKKRKFAKLKLVPTTWKLKFAAAQLKSAQTMILCVRQRSMKTKSK